MKNQLAPIVLFAYNRPWHTQQVLNSLTQNVEAKDSVLYVFCDGAKENSSEKDLIKIEEVRKLINSENRFKKVVIKVQEKNIGLANSIIEGVTEIVNSYGKVIVLEDDLILSPYFLSYMNDSLIRYENNLKVGQIGACNFFGCGKNFPDCFFLPIPDCLGWATWKDRWQFFNPNVNELIKQLDEDETKKNIFNAYGAYDFMNMLELQKQGKVDSWAIRWQAVCVLKGWLTLYPNPSMTNHIESNDATHANVNIKPPIFIKLPNFQTIEVKQIDKVINAFKLGYSGKGDYYGQEKREYKIKKIKNIKKIIKQFIPPIIFKLLKKIKKKRQIQSKNEVWSGDYSSWEDAQINCTGYDSAIILEKCKEALLKVKNGEAVYERDSVLFDQIHYSWGLLAGLQKVALDNDGKLCVLDFGGSLGSSYYQNKEFLSGLKCLEWCIVEQTRFVDCGKDYFEEDQLKFYHTIEECLLKHKPNVLLLSGVLQYLENPYQWIEKFIEFGISYIIIDRTTLINSEKDILTIQNVPDSIYKASYPAWFFNKKKFNTKFSDYTIISGFKSTCDPVNYLLNEAVIVNWEGYILKKN